MHDAKMSGFDGRAVWRLGVLLLVAVGTSCQPTPEVSAQPVVVGGAEASTMALDEPGAPQLKRHHFHTPLTHRRIRHRQTFAR